jgi:uncharacterized protein (TIGR02118 family)
MIKLICLINRPSRVQPEEFRGWWLDHHARVAAKLPGLRRYTISICDRAGGEPPFDGVAELWFDDVSSMEAAFASPAGVECSREDATLIGRRIAMVTAEHTIIP